MAEEKRRPPGKGRATTRAKSVIRRRAASTPKPSRQSKSASTKATPPKPKTLGQLLRGRTANPKLLRTVFLRSGLRYQTVALAPHPEGVEPVGLPDTISCTAGQTLKVRYELGVVVAELKLNWLPDVDGDGEWDGVNELDRTEVSSSVGGVISDIPQGWSLLQWIFTPASLEPWRALLTIEIDGKEHVFEELSGNESATHHGQLLIEAKVDG
jgi:hypothetical protein